MDAQERDVISGIFDRLKQVEGEPRDPEAERLIAERVAQQPYAPYAMAQALFVQEQALKHYAEQVKQLQAAVAQPARSGSFLGGLFGADQGARTAEPAAPPPPQSAPPPQYGAPPRGPWGNPAEAPPPASSGMFGGGGGGFLRGAMTTAAGVAGGALLFEGVRGLFGGHGYGSPFGGLGGGFGGQPVVNETVINEYGGAPETSAQEAAADPNVSEASWDDDGLAGGSADDSSFDNGGFDDPGDDDSSGWA